MKSHVFLNNVHTRTKNFLCSMADHNKLLSLEKELLQEKAAHEETRQVLRQMAQKLQLVELLWVDHSRFVILPAVPNGTLRKRTARQLSF